MKKTSAVLVALAMMGMAVYAHAADKSAAPATRPATPYVTAHEKALDVKEEVNKNDEKYTRYRVEFNSAGEARIPGYCYVPKDGKTKRPAILLQYGSGGNKNTDYIVIIGQQFVRRGWLVLTIDIPGKGDRKGPNAIHADPVAGTFLETCSDYSRATDYLLSRPDVDPERVCYMGLSWGAITGVTYVAHDPRIKVVASLLGGGNFLGMVPGQVFPEVREAVEKYDPVCHVGMIAPRPLLLLNVTHDLLVPKLMSESLHKAAGGSAMKIWVDSDHILSTVDRYALAEMVISWIDQNVGRGTVTKDPKHPR